MPCVFQNPALIYRSQYPHLQKIRLGIQEVMSMVESSKRMGHLVEDSQLCAGAVL
jgi:hypothetical protein